MSASVTLNGTTYTSPADFAGTAYVTKLIEMLESAMADVTRALTTTSATSETIGTGSKTFTMAEPVPFGVGAFVTIADTASPATNTMWGQVTARNGSSLTVNVAVTAGSGTKTAWTISISGSRGVAGADGVDGALAGSATGSIDMNGHAIILDAATFNMAGAATFKGDVEIAGDENQSFDESDPRDLEFTITADINVDFETPPAGTTYSHILWITQDASGGRAPIIRDGSDTAATWLGTEPDWTSLTAGTLTIISVFYAPNGTLYAVEVTQ